MKQKSAAGSNTSNREPFPGRACDLDLSTVRANDLPGRRQPQAPPRSLGRVSRIEYSRLSLFRHATASIGTSMPDTCALAPGQTGDLRDAQRDYAVVPAQRFRGVRNQIHHHALELCEIAIDRRKAVRQFSLPRQRRRESSSRELQRLRGTRLMSTGSFSDPSRSGESINSCAMLPARMARFRMRSILSRSAALLASWSRAQDRLRPVCT